MLPEIFGVAKSHKITEGRMGSGNKVRRFFAKNGVDDAAVRLPATASALARGTFHLRRNLDLKCNLF